MLKNCLRYIFNNVISLIAALKEAAESPEKEAKEKHESQWNGK